MTPSWLRQRLKLHVIVRLVVATVLLGSAFVVQGGRLGPSPAPPLFGLVGFIFAVSLALVVSLRWVDRAPWVADVHVGLDALLVSACVYLTGGVESLFTTLYALPIVAASTVQLRRGGVQVAILSAVLFVGRVCSTSRSAVRWTWTCRRSAWRCSRSDSTSSASSPWRS
jgi:two-component system sensor histidine kinase PilS (NtrC family)